MDGHVVMYADYISPAMKTAIDETARRREIQRKYNEEHGITPHTIKKDIRDVIEATKAEDEGTTELARPEELTQKELDKLIKKLTKDMKEAAQNLQFERAAELRDILFEYRAKSRK